MVKLVHLEMIKICTKFSCLVFLFSLSIYYDQLIMVDIFRYPIYHIPMGRTIKDLSTCFLTYHTLSSSFQGIPYTFLELDYLI